MSLLPKCGFSPWPGRLGYPQSHGIVKKEKKNHRKTDHYGTTALRPLSYSHGAGYENLSGFWLRRALLMWLRPTPLAPAWTEETGMQINASISFPRNKHRARKRINTWVFISQSPRSVTGQSKVYGLLKGWGQEDQGFQGLVSRWQFRTQLSLAHRSWLPQGIFGFFLKAICLPRLPPNECNRLFLQI